MQAAAKCNSTVSSSGRIADSEPAGGGPIPPTVKLNPIIRGIFIKC